MKNFFISSTFTDMHHERDYLHLNIFPSLLEEAIQNGDHIGMRDLRWGIHTSNLTREEADEHVLSVCLEEIDLCRPYMIVLIGDRYGSSFQKKQLEEIILKMHSSTESKEALQSLSNDMKESSITEMEIRYGTLWHPKGTSKPKVIFYIRQLEGDGIPSEYVEEKGKASLDNLKNLISSLENDKNNQGNIIVLRGSATWDRKNNSPRYKQDFCKQMTHAILQLLQEDWKDTQYLTEYQRELKQHKAYARTNAEKFFVRSGILNTICERLSNCRTNFIAIQGEPGSGKTSIMSYLAVHACGKPHNIQDNVAVLPLFCGYTPMTCHAAGLMRHMIAFIEDETEKLLTELAESKTTIQEEILSKDASSKGNDLKEDDFEGTRFEELRTHLEKSIRSFNLHAQNTEKRIFILIDSIDQLDASKIRDNLLFLPRNLPPSISILISCADQFDLSFWKDQVIDIHNLEDDDEIEGIFCKTLSSFGKEPEKSLTDTIKKKAHSNNPLYLSLLVQRLNMMVKKDFDTIKRMADEEHYNDASTLYKNRLIKACPDDLNAMCRHILDTASEQIGGKTAQLIVQYIAASRYGLRQSDLEHIFQERYKYWNSLSFAQFYQYMRNLFIIREDGRYDFSHLSIRDGFREMTGFSANVSDLSDEAMDSSANTPDTSKRNIFINLHKEILTHLKSLPASDPLKINEFPYHCWQADDKNCLIKYLCGISINSDKMDEALREKILKDTARSIYEICTATPKTNSVKNTNTVNNDITTNGTDWFCKVLEDECTPWKHTKGTAALLHFIHNNLSKAFEDYFRQLDIQKLIYTRCLKLAESLHQAVHNAESLGILADACYQLGNICHRQGGSLNYSQALDLYLREFQITENLQNPPLPDNLPDCPVTGRSSLLRRCETLSHLGDIYSDMGGHENLNRALRSYLKSRDLLEKLFDQTDHEMADPFHRLYQRTCQKIGSLQSLYGWESCQNAFINYRKAEEIISKEPLSYLQERISMNLRIGDLFLHMHDGNDTADNFLYYYQESKNLAKDMKGKPPKSENELTWLICCERYVFAKAQAKKITLENISKKYKHIFNKLKKLTPDKTKNAESEKDTAYISFLNQIRAVYYEHKAEFILKSHASDQKLITANLLMQKAEKLLEDLCNQDIRNNCRRDLLVVYFKRAEMQIELRKRNLSAPDTKSPENLDLSDIEEISTANLADTKALVYYTVAMKEANQLFIETRTPLSRHDYLTILAKIGDLYFLNTESGYCMQKAEEYYMLSLEEATALDKEAKSPMSMMDISLLCERISYVCKDNSAAKAMMNTSRMLQDKIQQLYGIRELQELRENCLNLYCSQIFPATDR